MWFRLVGRNALYLVLCSVMSACSFHSANHADKLALFHDNAFPDYKTFTIESEHEVFFLDENAITFVNESQDRQLQEIENLQQLVSQIFDNEDLGIRYMTDANTVAAETFANREANCLSLTIMAYAMAEAAGFDATFYEVNIPEYWTRREGVNLLNGHINLRITLPTDTRTTQLSKRFVDVDFDPQTIRQHFPRIAINKERVLAMFYNNRGADALLANNDSLAYAYFRKAATLDDSFGSTWVNLGVLYRRLGDLQTAKASYERAIAIDNENLTAWENLAFLHELEGNTAQAQDISRHLINKRENNPFYHFILGEEALDFGKPKVALQHYNRARKLDGNRHEFYFGLGKAHYELGNIDKALSFMKLAAKYAQSRQDEYRYMSKLSGLQSAR